MGKFKHILDPGKDGSHKEERSFLRFAIFAALFFLLYICVIKHDNLFRWIGAGMTIRQQEKQMQFYREDIERLDKELEMLSTNKDTLEKFARERFYFSEPGEDVYVLK